MWCVFRCTADGSEGRRIVGVCRCRVALHRYIIIKNGILPLLRCPGLVVRLCWRGDDDRLIINKIRDPYNYKDRWSVVVRGEDDDNAMSRQKSARYITILHWSVTYVQQALSRFAASYFNCHVTPTTKSRTPFISRGNSKCLCLFSVVVGATKRFFVPSESYLWYLLPTRLWGVGVTAALALTHSYTHRRDEEDVFLSLALGLFCLVCTNKRHIVGHLSTIVVRLASCGCCRHDCLRGLGLGNIHRGFSPHISFIKAFLGIMVMRSVTKRFLLWFKNLK